MKVDILSLFPGVFDSVFKYSILKRAIESGILRIKIHDLRSFTTDKHRQADDYRFGGGPGMLLKPDPIFRAFKEITDGVKPRPLVIFPTPQGKQFNQEIADELSNERHLIFLCGHYKGIDQRVVERWIDREYSIGDYVITGGETAVAVIIDAVVRMIPGVLGDTESALGDSFRKATLDCPHYTRPEKLEGIGIPGVLTSGHHKNIKIWRRIAAGFLTRQRRPDLLTKHLEE